MPIRVLLFAGLKELAGLSEVEVSLPLSRQPLSSVLPLLCERIPGLAGRLDSVRFAINEAFVDSDAELAAGDTLAIIPPVSGG